MILSLNKPNLDNLAGDIWKSGERLRSKFKPYEYQEIFCPSTSFYLIAERYHFPIHAEVVRYGSRTGI